MKQKREAEKPLELNFLEKNPRVKGERIFAIIMFGDTIRFKHWTNHPFSSVEKHTEFMVGLYDRFLRFRNGSGYFVKILGDGLMAVQEMPDAKVRATLAEKMLIDCADLSAEVEAMIGKASYPRPIGFRLRVVAGDVLKLVATDLKNGGHQQVDYDDYPVTLTHSLLQIEKSHPLICHESVKELLAGAGMKGRILLSRISKPNQSLTDVADEDLNALWSFRVRR